MLWSGFYPNQNALNGFLYFFNCLTVFILSLWIELSMGVFVLTNFEDMERISETLLFLATETAFLTKLVLFYYYKGKLIIIEQIFNGEIFSEVAVDSVPEIIMDAKSSRKLLTSYWLMATVSVGVYCVFPLLDKQYRLAVPVYTPYDSTDPVKYYLTHGFQCLTIAMCALLNTSFDATFGIFCTVVYVRLKTLKASLTNLDYGVSANTLMGELKKCSLLYMEILRATKFIEQIFTYGILVQFTASIFVICFTGFQLLLIPAGSAEFFHLVAYLQCMLTQVAIFCYYGHFVMTESSDIGQAIYLSNWYISDVEARKDVMILMERFKKPFVLTAGKLFPLNMMTFTGILRSSYSFFAVLQQMEK